MKSLVLEMTLAEGELALCLEGTDAVGAASVVKHLEALLRQGESVSMTSLWSWGECETFTLSQGEETFATKWGNMLKHVLLREQFVQEIREDLA